MAEVLASFDTPVTDAFGAYRARAVGRQAADGMWEAWLEFVPEDGASDVLATAIETRQPEREHLIYWAAGLTAVYLDGALQRARTPITVRVRAFEQPATDRPAAREVTVNPPVTPGPEPVLDPFAVGARNADQLRQELHALNRPRLLNIITAYDLNPGNADLRWMTDPQLVHFIVVAVEAQLTRRR